MPQIALFRIGGPFTLGELEIVPVPLLHGQRPILGFRIGDFAYLADSPSLEEDRRTLVKIAEAHNYPPELFRATMDADVTLYKVRSKGNPPVVRLMTGEQLKEAGGGWGNVVQFTTFLVHSQDVSKFYKWREREYPKMFPNGKYPPNTLLVIDRLVQEQFLIEIQTVAVV